MFSRNSSKTRKNNQLLLLNWRLALRLLLITLESSLSRITTITRRLTPLSSISLISMVIRLSLNLNTSSLLLLSDNLKARLKKMLVNCLPLLNKTSLVMVTLSSSLTGLTSLKLLRSLFKICSTSNLLSSKTYNWSNNNSWKYSQIPLTTSIKLPLIISMISLNSMFPEMLSGTLNNKGFLTI